MQHRFYDIVVECGETETVLDREFVLEVPEHDQSTSIERMDYIGLLMDTITAASGQPVCSFRSEPVEFSNVGS